jgi:hypothetical protein
VGSVRVASTFEELLEPFSPHVNARCFERSLVGDYAGLARAFAPRAEAEGGLLVLTAAMLRTVEGVDRRAVATLTADLARLEALGREPQLNVVLRYPRDSRGLAFSVDVYSFHADRAPIEADTFLCTYAGPASEGLEFSDAERLVDDPALRAALRRHHGRDEGFDAWLEAESFDLHFRPRAGATPFSFGLSHLWRIAVAAPGVAYPPCIHRAPEEGGAPRLLLIA